MKDTRDMPYTYKGGVDRVSPGDRRVLHGLQRIFLGVAESRRTMDLMLEFNKQVNSASKRAASK